MIIAQLLAAVQYCHDHGVVHRDVKPENIMVCMSMAYVRTPTIKLVDFGLALQAHGGLHRMTASHNTGILEGSMSYLAPEVRDATSYSEASDMWSIGVIMFVMFLWRFPSQEDMHKEFLEIAYVDGRDLVEGLLKRDPRLRLMAAQALKHPWTQQVYTPRTPGLKESIKKGTFWTNSADWDETSTRFTAEGSAVSEDLHSEVSACRTGK